MNRYARLFFVFVLLKIIPPSGGMQWREPKEHEDERESYDANCLRYFCIQRLRDRFG
jgi:hypothetical protein